MNLDDESYLSAYLDDELDPADRLAIEWSVESSPPLGEQLRSLGLARQAVAGLSRPALPRDLASIVAARLASDRRSARIRSLARPARVAFTVSGLSAIAASLIFALILLNHSLHPTEPPTVADQPRQDPSTLPHFINPSDPTRAPAPEPTELADREPFPAPRVVTTPQVHHSTAHLGPVDEARELDDRRVVDRMFDHERSVRIVIVTDVIDAADRVKDLIHQDARKTPEYGRISICQEIVLDPDWAEAAEVFVVPMDERGRRSFVDRLARQFPNLVDESDLRPELVTQLSEVGQVAVFRGTEAAPLVDPPLAVRPFIANRTDTFEDHIVRSPGSVDSTHPASGEKSTVAEAEGPDRVGPVVVTSDDPEARPDFVGPPNPRRPAPPRPGDSITLVVWVTRPARH